MRTIEEMGERAREAAAVLELTRSVELAQRELQALPTGGRTPLAAGLEEARRMLERQRRRVRDSLPLLVLITDGRANFSRGGDPERYPLPTPHTAGKYDFSFSGLKTAVINLSHNAAQKGEALSTEDLAASFCHKVSSILWDKLEAAARDTGESRVAIAGGVSANSWLRRRAAEGCREAGWELYLPELPLCGDNAAMIGSQGYYELLAGNRAGMELNGRPYMEIDLSF